jgi:hypothetical protein
MRQHQFGLRAGVDEDDRHAGAADARHDIGRAVETHVARPWQTTLRQHHREGGRRPVLLLDQPVGADIGQQRLRVRDGGGQADAARCGGERREARET